MSAKAFYLTAELKLRKRVDYLINYELVLLSPLFEQRQDPTTTQSKFFDESLGSLGV